MLELDLINALAEWLGRLFLGYTLLNKEKVLQQVRIFRQYLPQASGLAVRDDDVKEDYEDNFPCIIVKYTDHTNKEERRLDMSETNIKLLFGIYDNSAECEGWMDIMNMMEKVRTKLLLERVIAGRFILNMPLKTKLYEAGDTWPVYFGEMALVFSTGRPVMGRDFVTKGAVIDG